VLYTVNSEDERISWRLLQLPNIENDVGDGNLGDCLAKDKFFSDMLRLLRPKTILYLC
jgi:hypothetical protein